VGRLRGRWEHIPPSPAAPSHRVPRTYFAPPSYSFASRDSWSLDDLMACGRVCYIATGKVWTTNLSNHTNPDRRREGIGGASSWALGTFPPSPAAPSRRVPRTYFAPPSYSFASRDSWSLDDRMACGRVCYIATGKVWTTNLSNHTNPDRRREGIGGASSWALGTYSPLSGRSVPSSATNVFCSALLFVRFA
jgi:hypothetical protein